MARISSISLKQQPGYNILSIRKTINFLNDYSDFVGQSYDKINKHLDNLNILPAGDPFVCFHNMDLENLDVEAGLPIENPIGNEGEMISKKIPSQKIVSAIDLGPYEKQDPTLEDIFKWIQKKGYEMQGEIYYHYLNDPDRSDSDYLTKMVIPIK